MAKAMAAAAVFHIRFLGAPVSTDPSVRSRVFVAGPQS